jgi:hypothetical protein
LFALCTTLNFGLGSSHVIELQRISKLHLREQLLEAAVKDKWPVRRLREEVKKVKRKV